MRFNPAVQVSTLFRTALFECTGSAGSCFSRKTVVTILSAGEAEALLAAPDRPTWIGRRDLALLATALQTRLRVSESFGLRCHDFGQRVADLG